MLTEAPHICCVTGRTSEWTLGFLYYVLHATPPESTTTGKSCFPFSTNGLTAALSNQNYTNSSIPTNKNCTIWKSHLHEMDQNGNHMQVGRCRREFSIKGNLSFDLVEQNIRCYLNLCLLECSSFCSKMFFFFYFL